ncbi:MAG: DNA repair protein RadC [Duncaniella sp.]|nr:DNA repair protein RadC [Duncaniella sp.]MDE5919914.1 DNA repair protein RadC [Duncaniella sp.]MDE6327988.1 DNA repair protein RadC [Duncaniella sp.]MDE6359302.1 DNA repair protein RadC [Duncaniella sp.]MDE6573122.1 DNA repair protein RadC [Duncaniella sp.]
MTDDIPFTSIRISDLQEDDKPREKALSTGIRSLSDAELIAIIFGGGLPGLSVVDLARTILRDCDGRVDNLARLSMNELMSKYKGVGPAKAVSLAAAFELGRRNRESSLNREDPQIKGSGDVVSLMQPLLSEIEYEEFWVLMLSRSNRVTFKRCISQGGTAATVVDVKLLLKRAIDCLAEGIILVHNHPSGNRLPSGEDDSLTRRICDGARILGIRVLDHVIIARGAYYSYADEGKL